MSVPAEILATGFSLPESYVRACELGLGHLAPWRFLRGEAFLAAYAQLNAGEADEILLPFARRSDCDEIACFQVLPGPPEQVRVMQRTGSTYSPLAEFPNFWIWFRQGVEDMIQSSPEGSTHTDPEVTWEWFRRRAQERGGAPPSRVSLLL